MSSLKLGDAPKSSNSIQAPAGNHVARCYSVIGIGTHTEDGQYGPKTNYKIRIGWELPEEKHVFKEENGPEPFVVNKTYNFVMGEKSNLIKDLQSWRGRAFTEEELTNFELKNLIGAPCMVQIIHKPSAKGQIYANISSVTAPPKSIKDAMPAGIIKPVYYEVSMGRNDVFKSLPDFIQKLIEPCQEWKQEGQDFNQEAPDGQPERDENGDIPF